MVWAFGYRTGSKAATAVAGNVDDWFRALDHPQKFSERCFSVVLIDACASDVSENHHQSPQDDVVSRVEREAPQRLRALRQAFSPSGS